MKHEQSVLNLTDLDLELYQELSPGIPLWKTKGTTITWETVRDQFSSDIASYLQIRHDHLVTRYLSKVQKNEQLENQFIHHLYTAVHMVDIGSSALRDQLVYVLNLTQVNEFLISLSGKAFWNKKNELLSKLLQIKFALPEPAFSVVKAPGESIYPQQRPGCSFSDAARQLIHANYS